jgi:CHAT domain-containing protein
MTVSYAPSFTALREMSRLRRNEENVRNELFAFGNPEIRKESQEQQTLRSMTLGPLPETEKEVKALMKVYGSDGSKIYVGQDASEGRMKNESSAFGILHFATHGILDNVSPMYSNIVLARSANTEEDGLLEAWEILGMNLKAWLTVLSACETARGKIGEGEGVIGLTWAFFVAGVPTTLVSQWKVESESTAQLMLQFHRNLKNSGMSSAAALRNAELKLLRSGKYRHPFYWASFVIIGDGSRRSALAGQGS